MWTPRTCLFRRRVRPRFAYNFLVILEAGFSLAAHGGEDAGWTMMNTVESTRNQSRLVHLQAICSLADIRSLVDFVATSQGAM